MLSEASKSYGENVIGKYAKQLMIEVKEKNIKKNETIVFIL